MGSPVDDALDRLAVWAEQYDFIFENDARPEFPRDALATVRQRLAEQDTEIQRLQDELLVKARNQNDQEKIDAWWRARSEVKVDGNSRAEYVLQRDAAWERAEAAEARVRDLQDVLREAETGFNDISLILEAENEGYQERAYRRAVEEWRYIRALLAGSEAEPDEGGEA